jgi:hypothetical protein
MSTDETLIRYWYARLPRGLAPFVPRIAAALGDGGWTAVWVRVAAWAPVIVFGAGLFVPRTWPGTQVVFTESPLFLGVAVALSILSGTWGVALLLANGLREVLSHDMASSLSAVLHVGAGQLVAWLLLGVLVVMLPQFAHLLTEAGVVRMPFLRNADVRAVCRAMLLATIYPCLVLVWCQAVTVLIRPVFTWSGSSPSIEAVSPVGAWWPWMAAAAAGAALVRGILEGVVAPRMRLGTRAAILTREREASPRRPGSALDEVPEALRIAVGTAGMTILLAGMFARLEDVLAAGLVIGLFAMLARGLGAGWFTGGWAIGMGRIPGAVRVAVALGCGYVLADRLLTLGWAGTELRVMMIGTLLTLTLLFVLFPALDMRPWRPPVSRVRR